MATANQNRTASAWLSGIGRRVKSNLKQRLIDVRMQLGMDVSLRTADRQVLETVILPYFAAQTDDQRILFVGCQWYTKHYEKFFQGKEYWTIEVDPEAAKYGAAHHVTDELQNLGNYFQSGYFNVIIYNGVFGWGIDTQAAAEVAFEQCHRCLAEGGILVFGWNNVPDRSPFPPETCSSLQAFQPFVFPPLASSDYLVPNSFKNHTFRFYIKPPTDTSSALKL